MRNLIVVCCAATCVVFAAGCGAGSPNELARTRTTLDGFYSAVARHQTQRACELLTPRAQAEVRALAASTSLKLWHATCAEALQHLPLRPPPGKTTINVAGDTATARGGADSTVRRLRKSGDAWRIQSLGLTPLVPEGELPATDAVRLAEARLAMAGYCVDYISGSHHSSVRKYLRGLDTIIAIYRQAPEAIDRFRDQSLSMRQILSDEAAHLEGCGLAHDAAELDRVLANG